MLGAVEKPKVGIYQLPKGRTNEPRGYGCRTPRCDGTGVAEFAFCLSCTTLLSKKLRLQIRQVHEAMGRTDDQQKFTSLLRERDRLLNCAATIRSNKLARREALSGGRL